MAVNRVARLLCTAVLCATVPSLGSAQPRPQRPGGPSPQEIEDLRETVHLLMISRLKRELDLSDEQQKQIVPLLDDLEQSRRQYHQDGRRCLAEIRRLLASGAPEKDLAERVREARELQRGFEGERQRAETEIARTLTPVQQARLLVFMQDFRRDLRARLERVREGGGPARRPGARPRPGGQVPPQAPPDEGEDDLGL